MIFCSPLSRAKQALNNLKIENTPVLYDDRLKERNSNNMVHSNVETLENTIWYDRTKDIVYKDSEGFKSIINRTESTLTEIKKVTKKI